MHLRAARRRPGPLPCLAAPARRRERPPAPGPRRPGPRRRACAGGRPCGTLLSIPADATQACSNASLPSGSQGCLARDCIGCGLGLLPRGLRPGPPAAWARLGPPRPAWASRGTAGRSGAAPASWLRAGGAAQRVLWQWRTAPAGGEATAGCGAEEPNHAPGVGSRVQGGGSGSEPVEPMVRGRTANAGRGFGGGVKRVQVEAASRARARGWAPGSAPSQAPSFMSRLPVICSATTMFSTNVTIYYHLISQAGWNRCNSFYFDVDTLLDTLLYTRALGGQRVTRASFLAS